MAGDETDDALPAGVTPELLQRLAEAEARAAELWKRREKIVRYDDQGREIHDADALFSAIQWIFDEAHRGLETEERPGRAMWDAHIRIEDVDVLNGHLAGLLAYGIIRGRADAANVSAAYELVHRPGDDPTLAKLRLAVEQVANYEIHTGQFDKKMKRIIPVERPVLPTVAADAIPLGRAVEILETKLREARVNVDERPTLGEVWAPFLAFAQQPFLAKKGLYVDNDMCLAEYGAGVGFFDLVRQWSMNDADDGSYDHMEQLHLTLHYDIDPALKRVSPEALWSGDDVTGWAADVGAAEAFDLLRAKVPTQVGIDHFEV